MVSLKTFLHNQDIEPKDISIYRRAFTHLSCASSPGESYERLEFLGDSVMGMIVSDYLYQVFPDKEEGDLSRIRATVVSRDALGELAERLGLEKFLRVETARVRAGSRAEFSIMSDTFEALVGAVFSDLGYRASKKFVLKHFRQLCIDAGQKGGPIDFKSQLQEFWQGMYKVPPTYKVVSETGPDHNKLFTVEVKYKSKKLGRGEGSSKKRAEQEAAREALEKLTGKPVECSLPSGRK
jgi:ribonuclease III